MINCCEICFFYERQEIGDSDFGAITDSYPTCEKGFDINDDETLIQGFDRKVHRDCCAPDFFKVDDPEIDAILAEDLNNSGSYDRAYKRFTEKYGKKS